MARGLTDLRTRGASVRAPRRDAKTDRGGEVAQGARPPHSGLADALARARAGDEDGFRELYRAVQPGLLRYLTALVGADAEDVAAEAWLQIARDIGSFDGDPDHFRGWAATIARHRAVDHHRYLRRRPSQPSPTEDLVDMPGGDDTATRAL